MRFLYNLGIHLFLLFSLPRVVWALLTTGKYREGFLARLGRGFPKVEKKGAALIWIHAVSLGETKTVAPLIKMLKNLPSPPKILLTTATETGFKEGEGLKVDFHGYLPLDLPYIIRPIVKRIQPDLVLLVESDFWWNFQEEAKKQGAKLVLVNGKISEKTFNRWRHMAALARGLFSSFDLFCLQGELYKERFLALGIAPEKMRVTGNMKLDGFQEESFPLTRSGLGIGEKELLLTLGSTHAPEESLWIEWLQQIWKTHPHLRVALVPRHLERINQVMALLEKSKMDFQRLSEVKGEWRILLVDRMGVLRNLYALSDLAFVGGSFTKKVGGHNILEPGFYCVPALYGPHMHSQPNLVDLMRTYKAGRPVDEKNVVATTLELLGDESKRKELGLRGKKLLRESSGSVTTTFELIRPCFKSEA